MGGGGKGSKSKTPKIDPQTREFAEKSVFKPYTLSTSVGSTGFDENDGFNVGLGQPLQDIQEGGFLGSQQLMDQIPEAFGREASQFSFETDLEGRTSDIFSQQSALLQPQFAQQRSQLKNDLFGSGRMGLMLAGDASGAGAGGMVNPDAYGLGRAQSQTLANLAVGSREQALGEQKQEYNIESGIFGSNEALQQQRAQNLLSGATGMFGFGTGVSNIEADLLKLGIASEGARGSSYAQAASALSAGQQAAASASQAANSGGGGKGILGTLGSAALAAGTGFAGTDAGAAWLLK